MKKKIFHDTVHGSIHIPVSYCENIIDTLLFQRLRRIEQTSMRSLYPCAHHDRFIHSIGVFYLGYKLIENLKINLQNYGREVYEDLAPSWDIVTNSYKIACLLHDVGHAPFSHTFEHYFDYQRAGELDNKLKILIQSNSFSADIAKSPSAKQHEKISAILAASSFSDAIEKLNGNKEYVARMIIGCKILKDKSIEQQFVNCLIDVIHGEIDVDRLDYALRDQWAAGFSSSRLNISKLLRTIFIVRRDKLRLCFFKGAIDQIEALIQIKNFQKQWVFGHQNIMYDQHLLKKSIETLANNLLNLPPHKFNSKDDVLKKIFDIEVFDEINYEVCGHNLYLLSDDNLVYLLRKYINNNKYAKEWLSRTYTKRPLWKSVAEYNNLFNYREELYNLENELSKVLQKEIPDLNADDYFILENEYEPYCIPDERIYIYVNNEIVDIKKIVDIPHSKTNYCYYVYMDKSKVENTRMKIINVFKKITKHGEVAGAK